ncbi:MAG TPA: DUF4124 domain-containing protein [Burkholderiales bacterium]|nr:DUF4124 domain-containing protein [Burkholderiales bacterium]
MRKILFFIAIVGFAAATQAQLYKWVDKDGKVRYSDVPPPGVNATSIKAPPPGPADSAGAASKDAKKGPLTPAEQEQEYRKRQEEAKKESEKAEKDRQAKAAKADDCARAKEYLRTLQSGQRIARTDAAGQRYYMDESQTAQEVEKTKQTTQQTCAN